MRADGTAFPRRRPTMRACFHGMRRRAGRGGARIHHRRSGRRAHAARRRPARPGRKLGDHRADTGRRCASGAPCSAPPIGSRRSRAGLLSAREWRGHRCGARPRRALDDGAAANGVTLIDEQVRWRTSSGTRSLLAAERDPVLRARWFVARRAARRARTHRRRRSPPRRAACSVSSARRAGWACSAPRSPRRGTRCASCPRSSRCSTRRRETSFPAQASDSTLELRAVVASSIACDSATTVVTLAPDARRGAAARRDLHAPLAAGDTLWYHADSLGWQARHPSVASPRGTSLPRIRTRAERTTVRLTLDAPTRRGGGTPLRVTRHERWVVYRASDGRWYLGLRDWNVGRSALQRVAAGRRSIHSCAAHGRAHRLSLLRLAGNAIRADGTERGQRSRASA